MIRNITGIGRGPMIMCGGLSAFAFSHDEMRSYHDGFLGPQPFADFLPGADRIGYDACARLFLSGRVVWIRNAATPTLLLASKRTDPLPKSATSLRTIVRPTHAFTASSELVLEHLSSEKPNRLLASPPAVNGVCVSRLASVAPSDSDITRSSLYVAFSYSTLWLIAPVGERLLSISQRCARSPQARSSLDAMHRGRPWLALRGYIPERRLRPRSSYGCVLLSS